ncbi:MAG: hypothetical protein ACI8UO_002620 [Verrucomicrobiales bacterium]|jgi:hypothetical protein
MTKPPFTEEELASHLSWVRNHDEGEQIERTGSDFTRCRFNDLILTAAKFERCSFSGASMKGTCLNQAELVECDFGGADLSGALLSETIIEGSRFCRADFTQAEIVSAESHHADWSDAHFERTWVSGATWNSDLLADGAIDQPYLTGMKIAVEPRGPEPRMPEPPLRYIGLSARHAWSLRGSLEAFNELVQAKPPVGMEEELTARGYIHSVDAWTCAATWDEFLLECWSDLPVAGADLVHPSIQQAEQRWGNLIQPPSIERKDGDWRMEKWVLSDRRLVRRTLTVDAEGRVDRQDEICAAELPVPEGRFWAVGPGGRLIPVS